MSIIQPPYEALSTLWKRLALFLETIKFEHSIFALPFAVLSAFLVSRGFPQWNEFGWIILAMVGMRTFGMAANRLFDAKIDAENPRTASRAIPTGRITHAEVIGYMLISLTVYGIAVAFLNPITWILAPVPLAVMLIYPFMKRFTWLSHFGLGSVYLIVPPATALAFTGEIVSVGFILLGFAGMAWVAGFDVLYATADYEFDKKGGLHSIPSRFGIPASLWMVRILHIMSASLLFAAGALIEVGYLYYIGATAATLLLAYENSLVKSADLSKLNKAFFAMNGVIAIVFGVFVCIDAVLLS